MARLQKRGMKLAFFVEPDIIFLGNFHALWTKIEGWADAAAKKGKMFYSVPLDNGWSALSLSVSLSPSHKLHLPPS